MNMLKSFLDSWDNILTGMGRKTADSTKNTKIGGFTLLTDAELAAFWYSEGIGSKIVRCQVDDALRPWFTVENDPENILLAELDRLKFRTTLSEAGYWARLYGGSVLVIGWKDGMTLDQPRATANRPVSWIREYPVTRVKIPFEYIDRDPTSESFGQPLMYHITMDDMATGVLVHRSRCVVLRGVPTPGDNYAANQERMKYWGMSVLQQAYERLAALGSSFQGLDNLVQKFAVGKFKLTGLREAIAGGRSELLYKRMEIMNASASLLNGIFLDAEGGEDFTRDVVSFGGVVEFLDREMMALCGCPNVPPLTRLFGRSPAGLNATGESDLANYYDDVENWQETYLKDPVLSVVKLVNAGMSRSLPENDVSIKWGKPRSPSQSEDLTMRAQQAAIDKTYMDAQVYTPEEVRESRFVGGYSFATKVDADLPTVEAEEPDDKE